MLKHLSLSKIIVALCIANVYLFTCGVMGTIDGAKPSEAAADGSSSASAGGAEYAEEVGSGGQGTIDFITPDAVQTEKVQIEQLRWAVPPMAQRPVQSTFVPSDKEYEPELLTEEAAESAAAESADSDDLVINDTYETEEPVRPVSGTTATTTASTTATTPASAEPPVVTTPVTTTTTPATTTTTASSSPRPNGIRVDDDLPDVVESEEPASPSSTTLPTQPEPEIVDNSEAANEILYVNDNGMTVSGKAVDIISRITQNEMGYTLAPEAIKAQAVAAYTYVKYCNKYGSYPSVILSDNVNDSVRVLVSSVIGQAIYYDGNYIQAVYSASSAGYTASSENVWGNAYPYLVSVYCELDEQYDPNYGRTVTFSSEDMKTRVYNKTGISLSGDPSGWFSIDGREDGNYVAQLNIGGYHSYTDSDGDTVKISGRVFRERIMSYDIRSAAFDISYDASTDLFTITTYGYGHGVGMSQNGANNLAVQWGWDYKQILEFYYTGTEVR